MKRIIIGATIAALACGCVSVRQNDGGNACRTPCIAKDIVHEKFAVSDKTISAQDKINCLFGFICWGSSATHISDAVCGQGPFLNAVAKAKNGAYANACDAAKCDQVVGARYKVTTEDYFVFKKINAEITGYPASLTGVELIENKTPCACK
ncbi:MAG: hypothetical protein IKL96_02090 [Kiritimatiellae bacterium]|nr:hypothetical protein [Kiritimatiellia bacterium]